MSGSLSRIVNRAGIVIVAIWTCVVSVCGFLTRENAAHLFGAVVNADREREPVTVGNLAHSLSGPSAPIARLPFKVKFPLAGILFAGIARVNEVLLGHSLGVHGSIVRLFGVGMNRGVPCYQYRLEAC
jgi:hypothetical protein